MLAKAETNLLTSSASHSHSLYTVVKRLLHALLASLVIGLLVTLLLLLQRYQEEWLLAQTEYAGSSAARQYAKLVSPILNTNNDTAKALALKNIAIVLTQEPHVLSIAIFDERGQYIAPLPKTQSVVTLSQSQEIRPLTFVESVVNDSDSVIGYVHIHMNTKVVLEDPLALRSQLLLIGTIVLFLALVIGIYLTRGFYKFRPWVINKIAQVGNVQSK